MAVTYAKVFPICRECLGRSIPYLNFHLLQIRKSSGPELDRRVYLDQRTAMREGLNYEGHDHEKAVKRMYMVNNFMIYLTENATKFTLEEMCRDIIPAMLKPRARVEYVKLGGEELTERQDVINLVQTISRGIECKIEVGGAKRRTPKYKSNNDSSSESDIGRDDDSNGNGRGERRRHGKENMCHIPGHDHARKNCPNNRWSRTYQGPST